jgi:hypothetical protein
MSPLKSISKIMALESNAQNNIVFLQIFYQGRGADLKETLYADLAQTLEKECGLSQTDLMISMVETTKDDWSFGLGRAQLRTGEL